MNKIYNIFISYSTKDKDSFKIKELAYTLEQLEPINKCFYWEHDTDDDIYKYMNEKLQESDIFILACSPNANKSKPIELEWQAALKLDKQIIPIFFKEKDIPALLTSKVGVEFDLFNMNESIEKLKNEVLRRVKLCKKDVETKEIEKVSEMELKDLQSMIGSLESIIMKSKKFKNEELNISHFSNEDIILIEKTIEIVNKLTLKDQKAIGHEDLWYNIGELLKRLNKEKESEIFYSLCSVINPNYIKSKLEFDWIKKLEIQKLEQETKKNFENKVYDKAMEQFTKLKQLYVDIGNNDGIKEVEKYIDLIKEKQKLKSYHGVELNRIEYEVMIELEKMVGEAIPKVSEIDSYTFLFTFGYMEESGHVVGLGLYKKKLSSLPESIGNLNSLKELYIGGNQLISLPESIGNLNSLQELDLSYNKLTSLPESIGNLNSLKKLDISNNQLTSLPESIGNLNSLQIFDLEANGLTSLPERIKNALRELKKQGCQNIWN